MNRAQANLPVVGMALFVLTTTAVLAFAVADTTYASADRPAVDRELAVAFSERFVAADAPTTLRANVLNETVVDALTESRAKAAFPAVENRSFRVRLDGDTVVASGDPTGGVTIRRVVVVAHRQTITFSPPLPAASNRTVALPRRTDRVTLTISPPNGTTVTAVQANGRVVLQNTSGLHGTFHVPVSRYETTQLRFSATGSLPAGSVTVQLYPEQDTKAELAVTVDA